MTNPTQNAWVKFTPQDGDRQSRIEYFATASCNELWTPAPVPWSDNPSTQFILHRAGSPNFSFFGISFWGRGNDNIATDVVRTFMAGQNGNATFNGHPYVNVKSVNDNQIQFSIKNCFDPAGGTLSLEVTISATVNGDYKLFTTKDPEVPLEKEPP